jgi:hypothetical protein
VAFYEATKIKKKNDRCNKQQKRCQPGIKKTWARRQLDLKRNNSGWARKTCAVPAMPSQEGTPDVISVTCLQFGCLDKSWWLA